MSSPDLELDDTHCYRLRGVEIPSCTQVLTAVGASPSFWFLTEDELTYYRDRGRAVHRAIELTIRGTLDQRLPNWIKPYVKGWRRFCDDYKVEVMWAPAKFNHRAEYKCKNCAIRYPCWPPNDKDEGMLCTSCHIGRVEATKETPRPFTEIPLHHETFRYGVTPDVVARVKGKIAPIEIKATSSHSPATSIQTACQQMAVEHVLGEKMEGLPRWAVRLLPDEPFFEPKMYTERGDRSTWIGMLSTFNWRQRHNLIRSDR